MWSRDAFATLWSGAVTALELLPGAARARVVAPDLASSERRLQRGHVHRELAHIAQVTRRSGPIVVTAYYATNSQGGDPPRTNALAQRLAVAALDRVRSELKR